MPIQLSRSNIRTEIKKYLDKLKTLDTSLPSEPLELFRKLKREPVVGGPYPGHSMFEVANRVMSDLVVFGAVETLLFEPPPKIANHDIKEITALLGNENDGPADLSAELSGGGRLLGECFNVALTLFPAKFKKSANALQGKEATIRLIAFNRDAHPDVAAFEQQLHKRKDERPLTPIDVIIIPIDVTSCLEKWQSY